LERSSLVEKRNIILEVTKPGGIREVLFLAEFIDDSQPEVDMTTSLVLSRYLWILVGK
jgi:hypothetical protein